MPDAFRVLKYNCPALHFSFHFYSFLILCCPTPAPNSNRISRSYWKSFRLFFSSVPALIKWVLSSDKSLFLVFGLFVCLVSWFVLFFFCLRTTLLSLLPTPSSMLRDHVADSRNNVMGTKQRLEVWKASALPSVLYLWPLITFSFNTGRKGVIII